MTNGFIPMKKTLMTDSIVSNEVDLYAFFDLKYGFLNNGLHYERVAHHKCYYIHD